MSTNPDINVHYMVMIISYLKLTKQASCWNVLYAKYINQKQCFPWEMKTWKLKAILSILEIYINIHIIYYTFYTLSLCQVFAPTCSSLYICTIHISNCDLHILKSKQLQFVSNSCPFSVFNDFLVNISCFNTSFHFRDSIRKHVQFVRK